MPAGVYTAYKKDGTVYYRSSITHKNKHISLGSFSSENEAAVTTMKHAKYCPAAICTS